MTNLIVNLHRRETPNIGDLRSAPLEYFTISEHQRTIELTGWSREDERRRQSWLTVINEAKGYILGGGGLMEFEKHQPSLAFLAAQRKKSVIWGAGTNAVASSWTRIKPQFKYDYSAFGLIGCRDYFYENLGFEWVPCASCMHPAFSQTYEKTKDIVFFGNAGMKGFEAFIPKNIPESSIMMNLKTSIEAVVSFLGSAETVITSSYHGAYWALLLGRKVVGIPTSSKFYGFKHAIPLCTIEDWPRFEKLSRSYPEALEDCRKANVDFSAKVKDYLLG